jgi:hypothetical protein
LVEEVVSSTIQTVLFFKRGVAMLRRIVKVVVFLAVSGVISQQVEAYTVQPRSGSRVVQVYMSGYQDAYYLATFPMSAADVVLYVAKINGMKIERDRNSVAGEIRYHALAYMAAYGVNTPQARAVLARANPMDIEMWPAPWWYYILD